MLRYVKCVKHVILSLDVWCRVGKFTEDENGIGLLKMVNTQVSFIYCLHIIYLFIYGLISQ